MTTETSNEFRGVRRLRQVLCRGILLRPVRLEQARAPALVGKRRGEHIGRRVPVDVALPPDPQTARRARTEPRGSRPGPSAVACDEARQDRRGRRRVRTRRRDANPVGRTVAEHEWAATAGRLAQPRIDGQRAPAGDRRSGFASQTRSRAPVRRRRPLDVDGRAADAPPAAPARQGGRVQQRSPAVR